MGGVRRGAGMRLGQHFLKDKSVLEKIAASVGITYDDIVIEIGPGHGELTECLLKYNPKKLIAIERDTELAEELKQKLPTIEILRGDALKILP